MKTILFASVVVGVLGASACATASVAAKADPGPSLPTTLESYPWSKLATEPYKGKQDDIFFLNPQLGFYVNGGGHIYKTTDGGQTWVQKLSKPGTYFRTIAFLDEQNGLAGNIGTDYFPGVTDTTPLYATHDGGETWAAVDLGGAKVKGLCAMDILHADFINAGHLDKRTVIHAAGRVGGPAVFLTSTDLGKTWQVQDMNAQAAMILDVKFTDSQTGFLCAASSPDIEKSHALILKTRDGGTTWKKVYESQRLFESTWKCSFPTAQVGYATVQNYDEDPKAVHRVVAKTLDAGETWQELPLVDDHAQQEFGIAFASPEVGWVGTMNGAFFTGDGGKTFTHLEMGKAVNKIRLLPGPNGLVGYSIGLDVYKMVQVPAGTASAR
jgi:photosystem II stability/assembly factor-like uncharacterized protein